LIYIVNPGCGVPLLSIWRRILVQRRTQAIQKGKTACRHIGLFHTVRQLFSRHARCKRLMFNYLQHCCQLATFSSPPARERLFRRQTVTKVSAAGATSRPSRRLQTMSYFLIRGEGPNLSGILLLRGKPLRHD
jgi:hypothetical protein